MPLALSFFTGCEFLNKTRYYLSDPAKEETKIKNNYYIVIIDQNFNHITTKKQDNNEITDNIYEEIKKDYPEIEFCIVKILYNDEVRLFVLDIKNKTCKPIADYLMHPPEVEDANLTHYVFDTSFKRIGRISSVFKPHDEHKNICRVEFIAYNEMNQEIARSNDFLMSYTNPNDVNYSYELELMLNHYNLKYGYIISKYKSFAYVSSLHITNLIPLL